MKYLFIFILTCFVITACNDHERSFVSKYEHEDFSEFSNSSVHHRGGDRDGNLILMVTIDPDNGGPIVIKVDQSKKIKETDRPHLSRFSDPAYVKTAGPFKSDWKHLKGNWYEAKE